MIEIKDIRILFPAMISYEEDGAKQSIFVYIDQLKQDVIIPDEHGIDVDEFKKVFAKYYGLKNVAVKTPKMPNDAMDQLNQERVKSYGPQER